MRIVLETSVLVSALLNPSGASARVLDFCIQRNITLCVDRRMFFDYIDALHRPLFCFDKEQVWQLLNFMQKEAFFIEAKPIHVERPLAGDSSTPNDTAPNTDTPHTTARPSDVSYEVLVSSEADYLVVSDKTCGLGRFSEDSRIVTPQKLIERYMTGA